MVMSTQPDPFDLSQNGKMFDRRISLFPGISAARRRPDQVENSTESKNEQERSREGQTDKKEEDDLRVGEELRSQNTG